MTNERRISLLTVLVRFSIKLCTVA